MSRFPKRLQPWPTEQQWQRIAAQPSRFAPTVAEVQAAQVGMAPRIARTIGELRQQFSLADEVWQDGQLIGCSLTGRAYLTLLPSLQQLTPIRHLRLIAVDAVWPELLQAPPCPDLPSLDLSGNRLGNARLLDWFKTKPFEQLKRLNLSGNRLDDHGWRSLREQPAFENLSALNLSDNPLSVMESIMIPSTIRELNVNTLSGAWSECNVMISRHLEHLECAGLQLGKLPLFEQPEQLIHLNLKANRLRDEHFQAWQHYRFSALKSLDLRGNVLTQNLLAFLNDRRVFPELDSVEFLGDGEPNRR